MLKLIDLYAGNLLYHEACICPANVRMHGLADRTKVGSTASPSKISGVLMNCLVTHSAEAIEVKLDSIIAQCFLLLEASARVVLLHLTL